jgi:hypothetical protein
MFLNVVYLIAKAEQELPRQPILESILRECVWRLARRKNLAITELRISGRQSRCTVMMLAFSKLPIESQDWNTVLMLTNVCVHM